MLIKEITNIELIKYLTKNTIVNLCDKLLLFKVSLEIYQNKNDVIKQTDYLLSRLS